MFDFADSRVRFGAGVPLALADARGLVVDADAVSFDLRPITIGAILFAGPNVELVPGEETAVGLSLAELPRNADVKRIRATLTVAESLAEATPETTGVTVSSGGADQAFSVAVEPSALPRNVQVRLDGGEPFWSHSGTLPAGEHELPDFAEAANLYLDAVRLRPGEPTTLAFLVRSESPGRVGVELVADSLEYTLLQTQTWPNPLDGSVRIDRNLELDFGAVARIPLDGLIAPPARALTLAGIRLDVSGEAGPERLLGDVPAHDGRQFATVSPDYAVAQGVAIASGGGGLGFQAGGVVQVAGVVAIVEVDADAELYVELQRDAGGAPAGDAPLGGVSFQVAPRAGDPRPAWAYAAFPAPVEMPVDAPHWIVMRGIRGAARLAIADQPAGYLGALLVNRGGQLWKPIVRAAAPGPVALARVAYLPEPDNQTSAVALGFEGQPPLRPEPTAQLERLALAVPAGVQPQAIVVTSHARGTLTLSNVVQEFGAAG